MSFNAISQIKYFEKPLKKEDLPSRFVAIEPSYYEGVSNKLSLCDSLVILQSKRLDVYRTQVKHLETENYLTKRRLEYNQRLVISHQSDALRLHKKIKKKRWMWWLAPAGLITGLILK